MAICGISTMASATVRCISVPTTTASTAPAANSIEWSRGDNYGGIAACTDTDQGEHVDRLDLRLTNDALASCYCKMLRPVASKWYRVSIAGTATGSCTSVCAKNCFSATPSNFTF